MQKALLAVILMISSQFVYAKVEKKLSIEYYPVKGKNVEELRDSVRENGPSMATGRKLWAKAAWEIVTEFHFKSVETGCLFIVDNIAVVADVSLPKWQNVDMRSPKTLAWWQEFSQFMSEHENLHVDNVVKQASALEQKLIQLEPAGSCNLARQKYFFLKQEYLAEINFNDVKIDKAALQRFNSNERLFEPLRALGGLSIESGGSRSIISL